jgi:hypothetical protein
LSGAWAKFAAGVAGLLGCMACTPADPARTEPVYDPSTGRLVLLKGDTDRDGATDVWSYMDGGRVVRIELDTNRDGTVDRWEYYDANQRVEKVGTSRARDGKPDSWAYYAADGTLNRIELSMKRTGQIDRVEHYKGGVMVQAEEDTNNDSRMDKWEQYEGRRLSSITLDTQYTGVPDRRVIYEADGNARLEVFGAQARP